MSDGVYNCSVVSKVMAPRRRVIYARVTDAKGHLVCTKSFVSEAAPLVSDKNLEAYYVRRAADVSDMIRAEIGVAAALWKTTLVVSE